MWRAYNNGHARLDRIAVFAISSGRFVTDAAALPHASQQRAGVAAAQQPKPAPPPPATPARAGAASRETRAGHDSSSAEGARSGWRAGLSSAVYLGSSTSAVASASTSTA